MGTFSTRSKMESSLVPGWWALGQLQVTSGDEKPVAGKPEGPGDEGQKRTWEIGLRAGRRTDEGWGRGSWGTQVFQEN